MSRKGIVILGTCLLIAFVLSIAQATATESPLIERLATIGVPLLQKTPAIAG